MSEFDWLRIVWLLAALGLMLGAVRAHQLGGKRTLVMALGWLCIFMIAAGIAAFIDDWAHPVGQPSDTSSTDTRFT